MEKNLKILRNLFLSRSSLEKIFEFLDDLIKDDYSDENQLLIFQSTCGDELAIIYPPARSYCSKFLKDLIKRIEDSRNVVNETIYQHYIELLNDKNDEFHYLTYTVCGTQFTFKQSDKMVTDGTTGLKSWRAGLQLFEQIYANKDRAFKNKKILEIGSGTGLSGILISALCEEVKSYAFTDHHERVLNLIKDNLEINGFSLDKSSDKKSNNVFYKYKDEDGNINAKYYDEDNQEEFKSSSFSNGFGSFMRQGPMELVPIRKNEFSLSDDRRLDSFSIINKKESIFDFSDDSFNKLDKFESKTDDDLFEADKFKEKSKQFDKKLENFNEQVVNFEEMLKNFEEKLSLLDENVNKVSNQNKPRKLNSKFKDRDVDVFELDWFDSNSEIVDKLTKSNPDYLIGSDIIYDPSIVKDLCRLFKLCLKTLESCSIIVVNCIRNEETIKSFEQELRKLQKDEENIKIQRTKLSSKLTYFDNLETDEKSKFVLYNICNDDDE